MMFCKINISTCIFTYQISKLVHCHGVAKDVCVFIMVVNVVLVCLPSDATQQLFLV